jgi:hypothetical protein
MLNSRLGYRLLLFKPDDDIHVVRLRVGGDIEFDFDSGERSFIGSAILIRRVGNC